MTDQSDDPTHVPGWAIRSNVDTPLYKHVSSEPVPDDSPYYPSMTGADGQTYYAYRPDLGAWDGEHALGVMPDEWELWIERQGA